MVKPSIASLREVLTERDWLWAPFSRITPLKSVEIEKVVSQYYSAVDKWIRDEYEKTPDTSFSHPQNSKGNRCPDEQDHSNKKQSCDYWRQKARNALVTHTHAGMQRPFAVQHRRLLENLGIIGLFRKSTSLYYFAIAWQFREWYDHVIEVYYDTQHRRVEDQYEKTSEQFLGRLLVKGADLLKNELDSVFDAQKQQINLLEDELGSISDEEERGWRYKELLLDVWIHLHGISLDVSEKGEVVGWTYNRFGDDS